MITVQNTEICHMIFLKKVNLPDISNIDKVTLNFFMILRNYAWEAVQDKAYSDQFLVHFSILWLFLLNVTIAAIIDKLGIFSGLIHIDLYLHQKNVNVYNEKDKHAKGTVQIICYVFPQSVFLYLKHNQRHMVGKPL